MHLTGRGYHRLAEVCRSRIVRSATGRARALTAEELESLRQMINKKNEIAFHRWRPENFTYLYLFRAHEQPGTAAETPDFEPLVTKAEQQIAKVRVPHSR